MGKRNCRETFKQKLILALLKLFTAMLIALASLFKLLDE